MIINAINGGQLKQFFLFGSKNLEKYKKEIDLLNVFPVPDGDTGTNMSLTAQAAALRAHDAPADSVAQVAAAASKGALMGARGNSGVILSQVFRGWASGFEGLETAGPKDVAQALQNGVETAFKAVMKPVEGTILTVAKEGAAGAVKAAREGKDILGVLEAALGQSITALNNTPNLLPALKEAGVVDAGGKGLAVFLEGAIKGLSGVDIDIVGTGAVDNVIISASNPTFAELQDIKFQYCTEFIIQGNNLPADGIRDFLAAKGDSLLVVGGGDMVKVHIHTNHPGEALEYALSHGSIHKIKIDNMKEQMDATVGQQAAPATDETPAELEELGVLAVASGAGLVDIFRNLGASEIIQGGQTMNPSAQDLLQGVEKINARKVIILPNNKNIIMTAQQVGNLTEKEIIVVPSISMPQGVSALLAFDPENSPEANLKSMQKSASRVKTGEITRAVRDTVFEGKEIKVGDYLGLLDDKIEVVGQDRDTVLFELLTLAQEEDHELITLFYGESTGEAEAEAVLAKVQELYPELEGELHYGGQPLYDFIFSLE